MVIVEQYLIFLITVSIPKSQAVLN